MIDFIKIAIERGYVAVFMVGWILSGFLFTWIANR